MTLVTESACGLYLPNYKTQRLAKYFKITFLPELFQITSFLGVTSIPFLFFSNLSQHFAYFLTIVLHKIPYKSISFKINYSKTDH